MITTDDGVKLHYEEAGSGTPVVFVHEFAGDARSWEPQMRHFSRRYRCIAYCARGYPPSEVPPEVERYSQARARDDIRAVLDGLKIERAHIVGLSMGAFATLHFGMAYANRDSGKQTRALSLVVAGGGYGAHPVAHAQFQAEAAKNAAFIRAEGMARFAATYGHGATRVQYKNKDPRGFAEYVAQLSEHSVEGSANTMAGYQGRRPSLYALRKEIAAIAVPTLVVTGDEDDGAIEASVMIKQTLAMATLLVLPRSGHGINLEEPKHFNRFLDEFFHQVEAGRWQARDARAIAGTLHGTPKE